MRRFSFLLLLTLCGSALAQSPETQPPAPIVRVPYPVLVRPCICADSSSLEPYLQPPQYPPVFVGPPPPRFNRNRRSYAPGPGWGVTGEDVGLVGGLLISLFLILLLAVPH